MVCDRCISAVRDIFEKRGIEDVHVVLGEVQFADNLRYNENKGVIEEELTAAGFELVVNHEEQIVNQVKSALIEAIHQNDATIHKLSDFVTKHINRSYSNISQIFSKIEGKTIEQFMISHKIERAKELLTYDQLSISEISHDLGYSSPQHFSRQFKKITGVTPSQFEKNADRQKLDKI